MRRSPRSGIRGSNRLGLALRPGKFGSHPHLCWPRWHLPDPLARWAGIKRQPVTGFSAGSLGQVDRSFRLLAETLGVRSCSSQSTKLASFPFQMSRGMSKKAGFLSPLVYRDAQRRADKNRAGTPDGRHLASLNRFAKRPFGDDFVASGRDHRRFVPVWPSPIAHLASRTDL